MIFLIKLFNYIVHQPVQFLVSLEKNFKHIDKIYYKNYKLSYFSLTLLKWSYLFWWIFCIYDYMLDPIYLRINLKFSTTVTSYWILFLLIDFSMRLYIHFKNQPEKQAYLLLPWYSFNYFIRAILPILVLIHFFSSFPYFEPNIVSNYYHLYSPVGRGFMVHTINDQCILELVKLRFGRQISFTGMVDKDGYFSVALAKEWVSTYCADPAFGRYLEKYASLESDIHIKNLKEIAEIDQARRILDLKKELLEKDLLIKSLEKLQLEKKDTNQLVKLLKENNQCSQIMKSFLENKKN